MSRKQLPGQTRRTLSFEKKTDKECNIRLQFEIYYTENDMIETNSFHLQAFDPRLNLPAYIRFREFEGFGCHITGQIPPPQFRNVITNGIKKEREISRNFQAE
jgi:hypothetical protein